MGNYCYRCMAPSVKNGVCTGCGEPEIRPDGNGENALQPGTRLMKGRLVVGKKLGSGGFGVTYIAYDEQLKRRVALKEFMPGYLASRQGTQIVPRTGMDAQYTRSMNSFLKEARALYELRDHRNIVHVISVIKANNTAYYTMEMLEGESLLDYLRRKKKISAEKAYRLLYPIMTAIQYVHSKKMIHRDISPDNIMLCRDPVRPGLVVPKLIDFGAAHVAIEGYSLSYPGVKKNGFSPPEQNWAGNTQGPWTDVYSFCAMFYSAIVGGVPVSAQVRSDADKDPLKPPRECGAEISKEMQEVLMKGLKLDYRERTQSMTELIHGMERAASVSREQPVTGGNNGEPSRTPISPLPVQEPKRPLGRRIGAWLLETLLLAGGCLALYKNPVMEQIGFPTKEWFPGLLLIPAIMFLLDLILLVAAGGTLGQLLFGLKVQQEDGESNPGFFSAMLYSLCYASVLWPVGLICGLIWIGSARNIGPLEKMTGVTIIRRKDAGSQVSLGGIVSLPTTHYKSVHGTLNPEGHPVSQKPENEKPDGQRPENQKPESQRPEIQRSASQKPEPQKPAGQKAEIPKPVSQKPISQKPAGPLNPKNEGMPVGGGKPVSVRPDSSQGKQEAKLVCLKAAEEASIQQGKVATVRPGSKLGADAARVNITITGDRTISRLHCSFDFDPQKGWTVKDERSTNGTFVNQQKLPEGGATFLRNGMKIMIGKELFEFKC